MRTHASAWARAGFGRAALAVSVRDFGAAGADDASHDDAAAIQSAVDRIGSRQRIRLPRGAYRTSRPIWLSKNGTKLTGDGADNSEAWTANTTLRPPLGLFGCS